MALIIAFAAGFFGAFVGCWIVKPDKDDPHSFPVVWLISFAIVFFVVYGALH